ncbi:hypothetical protein MTY_1832 [Moorella thermoacetica Y72]|uniref:Uncharacterized protein n=1 Tax=Moorella thermoacetica Y72 TaxID=1325331 RepID=A0A0S6UGA3_NEOTH|nr:hypothetical protein MTY_1832 [Moorella thermoacetica Y72]
MTLIIKMKSSCSGIKKISRGIFNYKEPVPLDH